jgi:hypothetical protein
MKARDADVMNPGDGSVAEAIVGAAPIIVAAKFRALELKLACREDRALVLAEADELDPPVVGA